MKREEFYRVFYQIMGYLLIIIGLILIFNAFYTITGSAITENISDIKTTSAGVWLFFGGLVIISLAKKRGQAAMEFLMTYGWAILGIIIVISVLSYIFAGRVSSPNTPPSLTPPFYGIGVNAGTDQIDLELSNRGVRGVEIQDVTIGECTRDYSSNPLEIEAGSSTVVSADCSSAPEKGSLTVTIIYNTVVSTLVQVSTGTAVIGSAPSGEIGGGGGGGEDITPPVITITFIGGDNSNPYETNDNTPTVTATTDENADCRTGLGDLAYNQMSITCSGGGTQSHTCQFTSPILDNSAQVISVACIDLSNNPNEAGNNADAAVRIDTTTPIQSNHQPPQFSTVPDAFTITLNTNEVGDCRWSRNDVGYSSAPNDCTGDGTTTHQCPVIGFMSGGTTVCMSCKDIVGTFNNLDTITTNTCLTYTYSGDS